MARSPLMNVMIQSVRKVGRALARDFGEIENLQVSMKGPGNFVSAADRKAEKTLFEELSRVRPGWGFIMEERGVVEGSDAQHRWIVDPLDGTTNFLHGIPQFAISLALERAGVIIATVIYNPVTDELFSAERGSGAFLNDRRLRVAARRELADAVIGTGHPHIGSDGHVDHVRRLRHVLAGTAGIRSTGAAALDLAYVAAGRFDGFWQAGLEIWDVAGGLLLVREAGGYVSDFEGKDKMIERRQIVAGNEEIQRKLVGLIEAAG
ncbi:inositol monophosphatase family protein [Methylobrevis albus]|uniref:Inositol-1-monophosphatase n=1 Tax=Methylobrevis albus TaxID=2793297 RepID=A0A931I5V6_9HYPH|nr:inositol monophosphatase family protein [Methylobrevis albus]MBH0239398.1 inositol monophosphatase [Methylobrevis albus]